MTEQQGTVTTAGSEITNRVEITTDVKTTTGQETSTQPKDNEEKKEKDKEKVKEEEIPDYGGLSRVGKEYGRPYTLMYLLGLLTGAANGCIMPLFGTLFREMINSLVYAENRQKEALRVVYYFIIVGVSSLILSVVSFAAWGYYGTKIGVAVRREYYQLLLKQEVAYHDEKNSGRLNAKLVSEGTDISNAIGPKTGFLYQRVVTFIVGFVLAFLYSWEMSLVLIACVPAMILVGVIQGLLWKGAGGQNADPFIDAGSFSYEVFINIRSVSAYPALLNSKTAEYKELLLKSFHISKKRSIILGVGLGAMMFSMFGVMYGIGLWYGMVLVEKNTLRIGDMFGCYFSFMISGMSLGEMGSVASDMQNGKTASNNFYHVKSRVIAVKKAEIEKAIDGSNNNHIKGDIEFRNVSFAYASALDKIVMNKLSFIVRAGQTLAIVGPSGSGKSTAIALLERFYDPIDGDIFIDGQLIHNYDIEFLRSQIGYVSQTPLLFDTTIEENVRAGNNKVTLNDVMEACKLADAHDFISDLPEGYKTKVGAMGGRLSGGQKQRISIARALVKKPSILLLDEATSALDTKSEREVQKALDNIAKNKSHTIITIAHRLSTITKSDKIFVLVNGKLDESGTHQELMELNGTYATLVRSQEIVTLKREKSASFS